MLRRFSSVAKSISRQPATAAPIKYTISDVSGFSVISCEDGLPSSSVGIVVQAGPRFETSSASGVAHFLKSTLIRVSIFFLISRISQMIHLYELFEKWNFEEIPFFRI